MESSEYNSNKEKSQNSCEDCGHYKGECECFCCCSVSKIGCPSCIGPVLAFRALKKFVRKVKK